MCDELRAIGLAAGLDAVGIAAATAFTETRDHLEARRAVGLHGGMAFTYRNPARSTEPHRIVAGAQALVVGARRYPSQRTGAASRAAVEAGAARAPGGAVPGGGVVAGGGEAATGVVARYASEDHYGPLRHALGAIAERLRLDGWQARVIADDNALVDREAARRAGLGWYGKNTNLLLPGLGSWFVLGSVVTDAPLPPAAELVADGCGACRRCLPACPTGALVAPGVLDARRCLAWLVQAPGVFPVEHRVALGDRLYGCDDCQEVCPENAAAVRIGLAPASAVAGGGAGVGQDRFRPGPGDRPTVDLLELLATSDAELMERYGRWYIPRREPRYLRRNALVALANTADGRDAGVEAALVRALADADPIVRGHAVWAAARLGRHDLLAAVAGDEHPDVRRELEIAASDLT
ncbi:MAG: epoxyqueuosine reductase [Acidimicrobiaceae bacterium]|nr:epoxyqueuosine reductase [Acidimicrobiaceae bacterium]